jgi:hypothetical protein
MLASPDWRHRHAGLMAISVLAEGTTQVPATDRAEEEVLTQSMQVMKNELDKIVACVYCILSPTCYNLDPGSSCRPSKTHTRACATPRVNACTSFVRAGALAHPLARGILCSDVGVRFSLRFSKLG